MNTNQSNAVTKNHTVPNDLAIEHGLLELDGTMFTPIVFHGTCEEIKGFKPSETGIYFAESPDVACAYAIGYNDFRDGANILPAYLSFKNPLIVSNEWLEEFSEIAPKDPFSQNHSFRDDFVDSELYARSAVIDEAKRLGHDGLILPYDLLPLYHMDGDWEEQRSYVVFNPTQINFIFDN